MKIVSTTTLLYKSKLNLEKLTVKRKEKRRKRNKKRKVLPKLKRKRSRI